MTRAFESALMAATALCALAPAAARAETPLPVDLTELSIEELAQLEVRSASKQAEPLSRAATAIFVVTEQDIARSAATSLPEVLRLAPNLQVQRLDAREYAIGARGFNGYETSNKLLVQIDGRTVYTPLHSGVFWEQHSPMLENLQQIEVISGPGGTLYGPNAVNGIVAVTTKDARDTLGLLARATSGPEERTAALRYGMAIGDAGALRIHANGFDRAGMAAGPATTQEGDFTGWQAGFRSDFGSSQSQLTVQGDIYDNDINLLPGDGNRGHNLLARWTRRTGEASSFRIQAYYDDSERRYLLVEDSLQTLDVEAQHNRRVGAHELVVGAGLRTTRDSFINNLNSFKLDPESRRLWVGNVFVQDRFAVTSRLDLIGGVKLEQSSFAGLVVLPNARAAWHPNDSTLVWAAVSRAVRTPSRIDRELVSLPILAPAPDFASEKLTAFELGYRGQPTPLTSLSVSLFYNLYDDLRTVELAPGGVLPIRLANGLRGETWGIEAWLTRQIQPWWRGSLGLSTLDKDFALKGGAVDLANLASLGADPDYQLLARSSMDLGDAVQLDVQLRAIDDLAESGLGDHVEADLRLGWQIDGAMEFFIAGNNLLHRRHLESSDLVRAHAIGRRVLAGTRLRF